ncbi:hypothetical protein MY1884_008774, partial [Beauveria asiatica]
MGDVDSVNICSDGQERATSEEFEDCPFEDEDVGVELDKLWEDADAKHLPEGDASSLLGTVTDSQSSGTSAGAYHSESRSSTKIRSATLAYLVNFAHEPRALR